MKSERSDISDVLATRIWDYCESVGWGTRQTPLSQAEIQKIIKAGLKEHLFGPVTKSSGRKGKRAAGQ